MREPSRMRRRTSKPFRSRKHHIEHDQKMIAGDRPRETGFSIVHGFYLKAFRTKIFADQRTKLNIIVNYKNALHVIHFNRSTQNIW